jgi:molybdate transport system ATP-binding protein
VLARDVSIATTVPQNSSISNILATRIAEIRDEGPARVMLRLALGGEQVLLSRITRRSRDQLGLVIGMEVFAQVKSVALIA